MVNINFFGGPGVGKSTTSAGLFSAMKQNGARVEYVQEFAKELTFSNDTTRLKDQLLILGEQHHRVFRLRDSVDFAIHDSPIILGLAYIEEDGFIPVGEFRELVLRLHANYDNINIVLGRSEEHPYQEYGRSQTKVEAEQKDVSIRELLDSNRIRYYDVASGPDAVTTVLEILKNAKK